LENKPDGIRIFISEAHCNLYVPAVIDVSKLPSLIFVMMLMIRLGQ
jgi:hypothetical protein